ncbi:MAG: GNAT family N-acetyltransferase [Ruminococcaceae bacterium]|nr:GNAT family N-acetyltransferase [Oscillospiraceae bacterium]
MKEPYGACRALFEEAFPGVAARWNDALFARYFPEHVRFLARDGKLLSMLFSIPYPVKTPDGVADARYIFGVATPREQRGRGYATELLHAEMERGVPLFLRPADESLFSFYRRVGLVPFSPYREEQGEAAGDPCGIRSLTMHAYTEAREELLPLPHVTPTPAFLELAEMTGGAVGEQGSFAALYEREGDSVYFKEWCGDSGAAPRAAAFLGAARYRLRTPDPEGRPFGMTAGLPADTVFLPALD